MNLDSKIYVAGHTGLVGSAVVRKLKELGYTREFHPPERLELRDRDAVDRYFAAIRPEYVVIAAAHVGGIMANKTYPVDFISNNLRIQDNVLACAHRYGVKKLVFLGSSCIYPKFAAQPIHEAELLNGKLEDTNDAYAVAKIAGIVSCMAYNRQYGTDFIAAMPTNLYGPGDNFDLESSHVIPALIRKFHEAKRNNTQVTLWGTGHPLREFLYVDDLADALIHLLNNYQKQDPNDIVVNVGYGKDISIKDLSELVRTIVGYTGEVIWDTDKPDGTPKKLMDSSKMFSLGWEPRISLDQGIKSTYEWYLKNA